MRSIFVLAASVTVAQFAHAQSEDAQDSPPIDVALVLDTVEVSGLRPVPTGAVTGAVTVLDAEALDIRNASYLADELRQVPGLAVSRSGNVGGLTQVRIRGAEANHTLLLINGIEVSDPTTGESDFGLFGALPVDRIEVLRGEQSGLYGSDAIGGVIAVSAQSEGGAEGQVEYGSRNTFRGEGRYGFVLPNGGVLTFGATGYATDGFNISQSGDEDDSSDTGSLFALINTGLGEWELDGLVRAAQANVDTDPDADFDGLIEDGDRETESEQLTAGLRLRGLAFGVGHEFRLNTNTVQRENFADGAFTNESEGTRTKFSYSPSLDLTDNGDGLVLIGLIDYEDEEYTARDTAFGGLTNQDAGFETLGLALDTRYATGALDLSATVRFDENDGRFDDAVTGRIGAGYDTGDFGRLRASIGTGVKNPTFTELFGFFPGSFTGNPELEPEQSTSWEIGWSGELGGLALDLTYFDAQLEDEIFTAFNPDFTSTAQNRTGESERSGVEVAVRWAVSDRLSVSGQASFIDSSADDGADEIRVPDETASLSIDYRPDFKNGSRIGLAFDLVGEQEDFDFGAFPARRVTLDSYVLTSASAEYPLNERFSLTLRGENLFDEEAIDVFGFSSAGAGVFVGLKVR